MPPTPHALLRASGIRILAVSAAIALVVTTPVTTASAHTTAADEAGIAWTVRTVDNTNGAGRANFSYDVDPGDVVHDAMRVTNTGSATLPLSVYAADAFTTATGELDLLAGGEPSKDAGLWITASMADLVLPPGASADIPFTIAVPADARPGDHPAGIVTSYADPDANQTVAVDRRLGSRIHLRVAGELIPAAAVTKVRATYTPSWNPFAPGDLHIAYTLSNTGNTRLTAGDSVDVRGPFGLLPTFGAPSQLAEIMPGSTLRVERDLATPSLGWLSGTLHVVPEGVGLGAGSLDEIVVDVSLPAVPWTIIALILLVAAIAAVLVLLTARRRSRTGRRKIAAQ